VIVRNTILSKLIVLEHRRPEKKKRTTAQMASMHYLLHQANHEMGDNSMKTRKREFEPCLQNKKDGFSGRSINVLRPACDLIPSTCNP
jgi:hypothetical protein